MFDDRDMVRKGDLVTCMGSQDVECVTALVLNSSRDITFLTEYPGMLSAGMQPISRYTAIRIVPPHDCLRIAQKLFTIARTMEEPVYRSSPIVVMTSLDDLKIHFAPLPDVMKLCTVASRFVEAAKRR